MGKLSLSLRSLVPGPDELKHEISELRHSKLTINPRSETYTVDSDISPLAAQPWKPKGGL